MSTHNIGFWRGNSNEHPQHRFLTFYKDLTKIIVELSSDTIKYAPYLFCCCMVRNPEDKFSEEGSYVHVQTFGTTLV